MGNRFRIPLLRILLIVSIQALTLTAFLPAIVLAWAGDDSPVASIRADCRVGGDNAGDSPSCVYAKPFGDTTVGVGWQWTGNQDYAVAVSGWYVFRSSDGSNWTKLNPDSLVPFMPDNRPTYGFWDVGYCADGTPNCPLKSSTTYYYAVQTKSTSGSLSPLSWDQWSGSNYRYYATVRTLAPRPVRDLAIQDNGDGSVTLTWQPSSEPNVQAYRVYQSQKSIGVKNNGSLVATVTGRLNASATVSGLAYYQDYYFVVTAVDDGGDLGQGPQEGLQSVVKWVMPRPDESKYYNGTLNWAPPHGSYMDDTNKCSICHGIHSAPVPSQQPSYLLKVDLSSSGSVASLCFTCHDGTGSNRAVKTEFYRDWDGSGDKSTHPVLQASAYDPSLPAGNGRNYYGLQIKCTNCHSAHLESNTPANQSTETPRLLSPRLTEMMGQQPFFRHKGEGVCYTCHGNGQLNPPNSQGYTVLIGQPRETPFENSAHKKYMREGAAVKAPTPTLIRCLGCHKVHGAPNARLKVLEKPYNCFNCHGPSNTLPVYHVDHSVDSGNPENSKHEAITGFANGGNVTTTVQNTPPDIYSLISANPKDADTRHDLWPVEDDPANWATVAGDYRKGARDPYTAMSCTNCHNPHAVQAPKDAAGQFNSSIVVDPYNPSPSGAWAGASGYPGPGSGTNGQLSVVGFCWRCHDNNLPTASETLPWAPAPSCGQGKSNCAIGNTRNYENVYNSWKNQDAMGYQRGSRVNLQSSLDFSQWTPDPDSGGGGGWMGGGWMGGGDGSSGSNVTLPCTQCHDPHGSPNPYRLKPFMRVKISDSTVCGKLGKTAPCYEDKGPLIVYRFQPDNSASGPPVDIDPRFFCGACHDNRSMGFRGGECGRDAGMFPFACTRCHGHGTSDTEYGM